MLQMDLGFARRDVLWHGARPAPPDYLRLASSLAVQQAASRTAAAEARLASGIEPGMNMVDALVKLFVGEPGWAGAVAVLAGSFNPGHAVPAAKAAA